LAPYLPTYGSRQIINTKDGWKVRFPLFADILSPRQFKALCNVYRITATVDEMRGVFSGFEGDRDNLPSFGKI
jgi:hypothetical protein